MRDEYNTNVTGLSTADLTKHIHKLNNLVTVIQGNAELIKFGQNSQEDAEEIMDACEQILVILNTLRQSV